ncbi:hypothetical protein PG997_000627 [Apiospora hydei]|uniref:Uncharacterized protein n=1 Tax=Apiospora hydei TaxID=1337664 RepID=A0ABR1XB88_9PEZI
MGSVNKKTALTPAEASDFQEKLKDYESQMDKAESKLVDNEKSLGKATSEVDRLDQLIASLQEQRELQTKEVARKQSKVNSCKRAIALFEKLVDVTNEVLKAPVAPMPETKPTVSKSKADDDNDHQMAVSSKRVGRHPQGPYGETIMGAPSLLWKHAVGLEAFDHASNTATAHPEDVNTAILDLLREASEPTVSDKQVEQRQNPGLVADIDNEDPKTAAVQSGVFQVTYWHQGTHRRRTR